MQRSNKFNLNVFFELFNKKVEGCKFRRLTSRFNLILCLMFWYRDKQSLQNVLSITYCNWLILISKPAFPNLNLYAYNATKRIVEDDI